MPKNITIEILAVMVQNGFKEMKEEIQDVKVELRHLTTRVGRVEDRIGKLEDRVARVEYRLIETTDEFRDRILVLETKANIKRKA